GMSAAYKLRDEDFRLFELSDTLGGSSTAGSHGKIPLCHGAHYDLSYPSYYGKEAIKMLEELNIVQYDSFSDSWKFIDKKYLIPKNKESQTFAYGEFRKDVLPEGAEKAPFVELMKSFAGKMPMPTSLIDEDHRKLNDISFLDWLQQKISTSDEFIEGLSYHMKDDYGAGANEVSALAGIHYFACRPYYTKPIELFSPPEGNFYFIKKIYDRLPKDRIATSHLVKLIREKGDRFEVEVIDAEKKEITRVSCKKIIYAGHKHSLKYIFPRDYHLFQKTQYAPWVVVNFVLNKSWKSDTYLSGRQAFWQNEIISADKSLLGFVDSMAQFSTHSDTRVLTVYFCFKPEEREMMSLIEDRKQTFVNQTLAHLEKYFDRSLKSQIEKVIIKQMGHAMPIPKPGYLFNDGNELRSNPNLVYAGVDNGRLPLLFEAVDSGLVACELLN
ncbi:MAG: NAD(P)/FAD-dependent oxidoreductase, partial [Cyclobacteriaceae bacterium]|nr:NAD(P)/FAD-dependent oxidoreductase [Cyclobacteriaceae bacterium]